MIYQVFTVKDLKAAAYAPPFFLPRNEVALRTFGDALRDPNHPMHAHPEDYELYRIGEYADDTGGLSALPQPELLARGSTEMANGKR